MSWTPGRLWARLLANPLLQRVLRNSGYLLSANTLSTALSMVQGALAARMVGVAGLGVVGVVTEFGSNVNRLTSFRMSQLVVHYVGEYTERGKPREAAAVFKAASLVEIASSLVAVGLIAAFAPLAATYLSHDSGAASLFLIYGVAILANLMMESSTGLLQLANRFGTLSWIAIGQSVLTLGVMAVAFAGLGGLPTGPSPEEMARRLLAVVVAYTVGKAGGALASSLMALVEARRRWGPGWWSAPLRLLWVRRGEMIRFAWSTNLSTTLALVTRDSDVLWLSLFSGPMQVGLYKVAKAVTNVLFAPVNPLISTTYREVSFEISARRWPNVRYLLRSGSILAALWTIPATLGLVIAGRWFISVVYTPAFADAYGPLLILLAGTVVVNILYWNRSVLLLLGQAAYPNWVHFWGGLLKVAGTALLVPVGGAIAMAGLLSAYFVATTGVLVARTRTALRQAESRPAGA